jgi:hypothetical protein
MAKVECFTPDGKMEIKEPVDAKECVESCGYTMEMPEMGEIITAVVESEGTGEVMEEVGPEEEVAAAPVISKRGRKGKNR